MSTDTRDPRIVRGMKTQFELREKRSASGEKQIGWKIAHSAPARMEKLGIQAPLTGFLVDKGVVASGGSVSIAGWTKAIVEQEIAVYMGADLKSGKDREAVKRAIKGIGPALELVDVIRVTDDVEDILARNISNKGVVLGPCDTTRAGGKVEGLHARITKNGTEVGNTTNVSALPGELIQLVGGVADRLAEYGEVLRAGQLIITGALIPPIVGQPGDEIVFALDPIGTISVRFSA